MREVCEKQEDASGWTVLKKDLVLHDKASRVVKIYPYGSEEQLRWELVLEYLLEIDQRYLEKLLQKKAQQRQEVEQILAVPDQTVVHHRQRRRLQRYNLTQAAKILQVTRQGLYYWMKQGWVKARRDHRGYPVFTVFDIEQVMKWRDGLSEQRAISNRDA